MNKLTLLFFIFISLPFFHLQAQTGLQIISTCDNDSLCLPVNECVATNQFFSITATTDCSTSPMLQYNFFIDWGDDGMIDSSGSANNFTADFPIGNHRVKFTAFDFCGGEENCEFVFEVMDCVAPVLDTLVGTHVFVLPSFGQITLFPEQFISPNTFDNCTSYDDLNFYISLATDSIAIDTSFSMSCADIICNGFIQLAIWAEDESGNQDSVHVGAAVYDPNGVCPFFTPISTYAVAELWNETPLNNTIFQLNNQYFYNQLPGISTPCNGPYSLEGDTIFV